MVLRRGHNTLVAARGPCLTSSCASGLFVKNKIDQEQLGKQQPSSKLGACVVKEREKEFWASGEFYLYAGFWANDRLFLNFKLLSHELYTGHSSRASQ